MKTNLQKKADAELRAKETYRRLMKLREQKQPNLSNNDWTKRAGVSTSFFTNMQGKTKPASEPTVGNLRAVLEVIGVSLPEFFVHEARGRLSLVPTQMDIPSRTVRRDYTGMEFCANMKRYRLAKEMKQDQLAELLGVSQATIQRWENGKREPKHSDLERIAAELGVTVADLFRDGDQSYPFPSADELAMMIQDAMDELPVGVTYADYPTAVSSSLYDRLKLFQADRELRKIEDEAISPDTGAQFPAPTMQSAEEEPRIP